MPVTKKSATAFVYVRGLGITCFNPNRSRNETAIIRSGNHKLKLGIFRPEFADIPGKDVFVYQPVRPEFDFGPNDEITIEIGVNGNSRYEGYEMFEPGDFNRLDVFSNDPDDLRWVVNLEGTELHGSHLEKNLAANTERPPVTRLHISGGLFYAVMPTESQLAKSPFFQKHDPQTGKLEPFGYIAETMGANLEADEVTVVVTVNGKSETVTLKRVDGLPYKIEISNVDPDPDAMASDLPVCYQFLRDPTGLEFSLIPQDDGSEGGPVIGKNYCHIARMDQPTIDNFV